MVKFRSWNGQIRGARVSRWYGLPTYDWYLKEFTLLNTRAARPRDFTSAIAAIRDGVVRPGPLITSTYPLDDTAAALAASARTDQVKVTLSIGEDAN